MNQTFQREMYWVFYSPPGTDFECPLGSYLNIDAAMLRIVSTKMRHPTARLTVEVRPV